ncbi:MAG: hypothetical protein KBC43_04255 [Bacteroidales bacterium]|nr:hypothetical protein [Bacteroidales bacterium]
MVRLVHQLKYLFYIFLFAAITGCPEELPEDDMNIYIENNSNSKLVVFASHNEPNEVMDTTLVSAFPWGTIDNINKEDILQPHSIVNDYYYSEHLKKILEQGWMHYFIFYYDSLSLIPWERIRDEYIVAKRIDFDTWEDLENCNFKIEYP